MKLYDISDLCQIQPLSQVAHDLDYQDIHCLGSACIGSISQLRIRADKTLVVRREQGVLYPRSRWDECQTNQKYGRSWASVDVRTA
jgi:hypothetical protein